MQDQFTYRELSEKLDINFAKVKRWGREFLPPDYSAGQGQGVARVLTIDEAFILYLSGHLVSEVKYSIPETKKIMGLLVPYLKDKNLMPSSASIIKELAEKKYEFGIYCSPELDGVSLISELTVKKVKHKSVEVSHNDFTISRHRLEQEKIIEWVNFHHINRTQIDPKTLYVNTIILHFLSKLRGMVVYEDLGSHTNEHSHTIATDTE